MRVVELHSPQRSMIPRVYAMPPFYTSLRGPLGLLHPKTWEKISGVLASCLPLSLGKGTPLCWASQEEQSLSSGASYKPDTLPAGTCASWGHYSLKFPTNLTWAPRQKKQAKKTGKENLQNNPRERGNKLNSENRGLKETNKSQLEQ